MSTPAQVKVVSVKVVKPAEGEAPLPRPRFQRPVQLPSAAVMARGLLAAGLGTAMRLLKGQPLARSAADQAACLAICTGDATRPKCEQWIHESQRCGACGCFGDLAVRLAAKSCPLGKWPPLTGAPPHGATEL